MTSRRRRVSAKPVCLVALAAGIAALQVSSEAHAQARILVYGPGVTTTPTAGSVTDPRTYFPAGAVVTIAPGAMWSTMTTADFAAFDAIWVDADICSTTGANLVTLRDTQAAWGPAVRGRIVLLSSDPMLHASGASPAGLGARAIQRNSAAWITGTGRSASGGSTGMYLQYGCRNAGATNTEVPVNAFEPSFGAPFVINRSRNDEVATITGVGSTHPVLAGITASGGTANLSWASFCHGTITSLPPSWASLTTCANAPAGELGSLAVRGRACPAPTITGTSVAEGSTGMLMATTTEAGATVTWDLDNNGTFETAGAAVAFNASAIDGPAMRTVGVRLSAMSCDIASSSTTTVSISNVAPTFSSMPPNMARVGVAYSYTPTATDPAGAADPLAFSLTAAPPGATFAGGALAWTPTAAQMGQMFTFTITVTDGDGGTTAQTWTVTVGRVDSDGDGVVDLDDADDDNDGVPDVAEGSGRDPSRDADGDGVFDYLDRDFAGFIDGNADGVDDRVDTDLDGTPNHLDLDADNDGVFDVIENGNAALDANRDGRLDAAADADSDGLLSTVDSNDADRSVITTRTPAIDTDRDMRIDSLDADDDNDGVPTRVEVGAGGQYMPRNSDASAAPGVTTDMVADYLDTDDDGDGFLTADELGAGGAGAPRNSDSSVAMGQGTSDMLPDFLDADDDGDGIPSSVERTIAGMTPDPDMDMAPAWLDRDSDGDTVPDVVEAGATPAMPVDSDTDGARDFLDIDSDNDCVPDRDPREAGAARTNAMTPSMDANNNCANPTPVCNTMTGTCVADRDDDMDGIPNLDERRIGSNPMNPDTDGDGVRDGLEVGAGPMFTPRDTDGDTRPDWNDTDDDGDGVETRDELGAGGATMPQNSDGAAPMGEGAADMIPDWLDADDDGDGIPTRIERDLEMMGGAPDMDMTPAYLDRDSDGDGIPDAIERGMDGAMPRNSDGADRPDFLDLDSDNDTVDDQTEAGAEPRAPRNTDAMVPMGMGTGDTLPDYIDPDDDGDSIPTSVEVRAEGMLAGDGDMVPAFLDLDSDGDGVSDSVEVGAMPMTPANSDGMAAMGDRPDFLDTDSDNDCAPDSDAREAGAARIDPTMPSMMANANCMEPTPICATTLGRCVSNDDLDGDGVPNVDETRLGTNPMNPDTDGDGVPDGREVGAGPTFMGIDTDMDGTIDARDDDDDGDGVPTRDELGAGGVMSPRNTDAMVPMGMGTSDTTPDYLDSDDDGDGIPTRTERTLEGMSAADGDNVPAFLDTDSDGDGVADSIEAGATPATPANSDGMLTGDRPDFLDTDSDNDCLADSEPRESGAARVDPSMPSASADSNCMNPTPVCDRAVGRCVGRPAGDAGVEAGTDGGVMDSGVSPAAVLSGDGACACRVPAAGGGAEHTASALAALAGLALVYGARRRNKRGA